MISVHFVQTEFCRLHIVSKPSANFTQSRAATQRTPALARGDDPALPEEAAAGEGEEDDDAALVPDDDDEEGDAAGQQAAAQ